MTSFLTFFYVSIYVSYTNVLCFLLLPLFLLLLIFLLSSYSNNKIECMCRVERSISFRMRCINTVDNMCITLLSSAWMWHNHYTQWHSTTDTHTCYKVHHQIHTNTYIRTIPLPNVERASATVFVCSSNMMGVERQRCVSSCVLRMCLDFNCQKENVIGIVKLNAESNVLMIFCLLQCFEHIQSLIVSVQKVKMPVQAFM